MKYKSTIFLTALALGATTILSDAQDATTPKAPAATDQTSGRQRGGPGGNMQEFMQRMNDRLKTSLKVTDEEWAILKPLIERVQTAQRDAGGRGGFGGRPRGGPGGDNAGNPPAGGVPSPDGNPPPAPAGDQPARPGAAETQALRTALENESTPPEELKAKLAAVREVRKKGAAELANAREDLKKVVTVRQEAVLVSIGLLE